MVNAETVSVEPSDASSPLTLDSILAEIDALPAASVDSTTPSADTYLEALDAILKSSRTSAGLRHNYFTDTTHGRLIRLLAQEYLLSSDLRPFIREEGPALIENRHQRWTSTAMVRENPAYALPERRLIEKAKAIHLAENLGLRENLASAYKTNHRVVDGYVTHQYRDELASAGLFSIFKTAIRRYEGFLDGSWTPPAESRAQFKAEYRKTEHDPLKHIPIYYDENIILPILRFLVQDSIIAVPAAYFGSVPCMTSIRLLYSPNENDQLLHAQNWHIDPEGSKQLKLFINVRQVHADSGPFTFLPAGLSNRLYASKPAYRSKRVADKFMQKYSASSAVSNTGKPGRAVFVDTSNCYHFGSRKGTNPRYLLYAQFMPVVSAALLPTFKSMLLPYAQKLDLSNTQRMLFQTLPEEAA